MNSLAALDTIYVAHKEKFFLAFITEIYQKVSKICHNVASILNLPDHDKTCRFSFSLLFTFPVSKGCLTVHLHVHF